MGENNGPVPWKPAASVVALLLGCLSLFVWPLVGVGLISAALLLWAWWVCT